MNQINLLRYNWFYTNNEDGGEGYEEVTRGKHGIKDIWEVKGGVEKPYHICIAYEDGRIEEVFNPNLIQKHS